MVYNYTIPRGPIMAMYTSPGPCYQLPGLTGHIVNPHDPRSVHDKKPAWTFGTKNSLKSATVSPGPKYYPPAKLYRDGYDGQPHYSMRKRLDDLTPQKIPGPGTYKPEKNFASSKFPNAPLFSMRDRTKLRSLDKTPAPNTYTLPKVLGGTTESTMKAPPVYSMRKKPVIGGFAEDRAKAPGPGTYDAADPCVNRNREPHYSMAARVFMPRNNTQIPGPGAHRPEMVNLKRRNPDFSFGIRHSQYTTLPMMEPPLE